MNPAQVLGRASSIWRRVGRVPLVLRVIVAVAAAVATLATTSAAWDVPDVYVIVAVLAAGAWVVSPDSASGLTFTAALAVAWLAGASGGIGPAVVVVAIAMLAAHVAAALAAALPLTAAADPALILRWARPTVAIAVAVLIGVGLVAVVDAWSPPGSLVVMLGALTLLTLAGWWWAMPPERGDGR